MSNLDWLTKPPLDFPKLKYIFHPGIHETVEDFLEKYLESELFDGSGYIFINNKEYFKYDKNTIISINYVDENYFSKRINSILMGTYSYSRMKNYYFYAEHTVFLERR